MFELNEFYRNESVYYETVEQVNDELNEMLTDLDIIPLENFFTTQYFFSTNMYVMTEKMSERSLDTTLIVDKTDEELFAELYASEDIPNVEDFDVESFVQYCENVYGMSTEQFKVWFEAEEYEGNVDMQRWYHFTKHKMSDGEWK